MISKEYFVLKKNVDNEMIVDTDDSYTDDAIYSEEFLDPNKLLNFEFDTEDISNPILYDFLTDGYFPLISEGVKEVLELFDYHSGIQFIPSILTFNDKIFDHYYLFHVISFIPCFDQENSVFRVLKNIGEISSIKKLVLIEEKLKKVPFKERLIFRLAEDQGVYLFHESVVEALLKIKPSGFRLIPVDQWNSYLDE